VRAGDDLADILGLEQVAKACGAVCQARGQSRWSWLAAAAEVIDGKARALVRGSAFQACCNALTASWIPAGKSAARAD
jgi:hypothetical protein